MRRAVLTILALVVAVVGPARPAAAQVLLPPAPPPAGSIGIRLLEAPADAEDDPRAQVHIVDHLAPGTVISRRVEISSTTGSTLHAALYPSAASIEGGSFIGAEGHTDNELSSWISVDPPGVDVPADGLRVATVTIAVPSDAPPGEQYAVVWAEARSAPVDGGLAQVSRVGLRIYLSVGPGGAPAPDFTIESLTAERRSDGAPGILATVHNTGGRALDLAGTLELSDGPGGVRAGLFRATLGTTLAVGATERVTIALDGDLPAGPWLATVTLYSGRIERAAAATVTFPAAGRSGAVDAAEPQPSASNAVVFVALALGLALLVALVIILLRRRGRHPLAVPAPVRRPDRVAP